MKKTKYLLIIVCLIILSSCQNNKPVEIEEKNDTPVVEKNETKEVKDEMDLLPVENNNIDTLVNYSVNEKGDKVNNSSKMSETHNSGNISGLKMEIISKKDNPRYATFTLTLKNNSSEDYSKKDVKINFVDKNGESQNLILYQVDSFLPGETIKIEKEEYIKIIDAEDYTIELTEITGVG